MTNYSNFAIITSFFGLWIDSFFKTEFQIYLGFVLIFSFGILHGANDLLLIESINKEKKTNYFYKILIYYILVVITGGILFYYIPSIALISFIIVSGYHFGEQQWQNIEILNQGFKYTFFFCYGIFILFLLFYFHQIEVQSIVTEITAIPLNLNIITNSFKFFGGILFLFFLYLYIIHTKIRKQILLEIFYLIVYAIIFFSSSLIWSFTIYFIIWHSIPSILNQVNFLYGNCNTNYLMKYFKSAALYWILSIAGLFLFYVIFKDLNLFNSLFFSFLAAITFPHVIVILKMFRTNN
ncbi:MAG: Brp/Blh family beta-carotene 15,15'-dioxygenase [Flavobacterium sp.]|uniref:Brp/Blh family beta-carotene 15,15'-dioxygenase n=1 Tax=Flavobacterium sp. TaxID=239 RepID=UPI003266AC86